MIKRFTTLFVCIAALVGLVMVAPAQDAKHAPNDVSVQTENASVAGGRRHDAMTTTAPTGKKPLASSPRNPFRYRIPQSGYVPTSYTTIPSGIELLAIMVVQNQKPLAVLQVPGMVTVFYVQEGDSISYEQKINAKESRIVHLRIDAITSQQVELHLEDNLESKRVLR
jgi:hypothetical protein